MTPALGAHKSKLDVRDHKDKSIALVSALPSEYFVDISSLKSRMQHYIGKCVGEGNAKRVDNIFGITSSDDFIYFGAKSVDGNLTEGTSIRSALKFMQKNGVCLFDTWSVPVTDKTTYADYIKNDIPQYAKDEAVKYKIGQYFNIPIDETLIKAALVKYGMLVVRMEVGQEWYTPSWASKDILPLKAPKQVISGHCVVIYGYSTDENGTKFYISNSWSTLWADNGNGYFYFKDYKPTEVWAVTLNPVPTTNLVSLEVFQAIIKVFQKIGMWTTKAVGGIIS